MSATKVAVTGATGQVGAALVKRFRAEGLPVVATARNALGAALIHAFSPDADIRIGSLTPAPGESHILDDCDLIVNCALAGSGGVPRLAYTRNMQLIDGLLRARSMKRLIHFSTVAVYGELIRQHDDPAREFHKPRPNSEYGRSKLHVERYAARRCRARHISLTVLRLGHVYGAGIGRSREIIEFARDPDFRLPYAGRLPSNAILVDRVCGALLQLFDEPAPLPRYDMAESELTWRDIFDWHTDCLRLPPVKDMSDAESNASRAIYAERSVPREFAAWVRRFPIRDLVRSPATFDLALRVLAKTPTVLTRRVSAFNRQVEAGRQTRSEEDPIGPLYLSAGMPGPFLPIPDDPVSGIGSPEDTRRELREWYRGWSVPILTTRVGESGV